jgi:hypothetical protein
MSETIYPRVLVTGGRDYADAASVDAWLTSLTPSVIAEGGASGADRLAAIWAHDNDVRCETFPARWALHGRAAGPIRNQQMLDEFNPDIVLAFPGGRGTADMVARARKKGVRVVEAAA